MPKSLTVCCGSQSGVQASKGLCWEDGHLPLQPLHLHCFEGTCCYLFGWLVGMDEGLGMLLAGAIVVFTCVLWKAKGVSSDVPAADSCFPPCLLGEESEFSHSWHDQEKDVIDWLNNLQCASAPGRWLKWEGLPCFVALHLPVVEVKIKYWVVVVSFFIILCVLWLLYWKDSLSVTGVSCRPSQGMAALLP